MASLLRTIFLIALLSSAGALNAQDQSLADAARKAKEQKAQDAAAKPKKVYTNDNVAASSSDSGAASTAAPIDTNAKQRGTRDAEQWKNTIKQQKAVVDAQQKQIDQLQASIHYVDANEYSNGPAYNADQKKKQDRVEIMKSKLAQEQQNLDDLKEQARKAGFGSSVYDQ